MSTAKTSKSKPGERYLQSLQKRYAQVSKKERGQMLDEFVKTTGYHRKHGAEILSRRYQRKARPWARQRARYYTDADRQAIWQVAEWFDQIGSKRLRAGLDVELAHLQEQGHLRVSEQTYQHLQKMSAATMDRIRALKPVAGRALRGGTKPGSLLKRQVPIRTFANWDNKQVGFVEIDLVQHDGGSVRGVFTCTLTLTEVSTGWAEIIAVRNKAQKHVFTARVVAVIVAQKVARQVPALAGGDAMARTLSRATRTRHPIFGKNRVSGSRAPFRPAWAGLVRSSLGLIVPGLLH